MIRHQKAECRWVTEKIRGMESDARQGDSHTVEGEMHGCRIRFVFVSGLRVNILTLYPVFHGSLSVQRKGSRC